MRNNFCLSYGSRFVPRVRINLPHSIRSSKNVYRIPSGGDVRYHICRCHRIHTAGTDARRSEHLVAPTQRPRTYTVSETSTLL